MSVRTASTASVLYKDAVADGRTYTPVTRHEPRNQADGEHHEPAEPGIEQTPQRARQPISRVHDEKLNESSLPAVDAAGIRLFSVDELSQALGQSKRWVYRQVEERDMPALKLGRQLVFQLPAVMAWLEAQRVGDWTAAGDER